MDTVRGSCCDVPGRVFEPVKGMPMLGHVRQPDPIHPFRLARSGQAPVIVEDGGNPARSEGPETGSLAIVEPEVRASAVASRLYPDPATSGPSTIQGREVHPKGRALGQGDIPVSSTSTRTPVSLRVPSNPPSEPMRAAVPSRPERRSPERPPRASAPMGVGPTVAGRG